MGNYERTLQAISYYEERIEELRNDLRSGCHDALEEEDIMMELADAEQSLGECRGYLEELAQTDGYPSYESMMYDSFGWTY